MGQNPALNWAAVVAFRLAVSCLSAVTESGPLSMNSQGRDLRNLISNYLSYYKGRHGLVPVFLPSTLSLGSE